jgi:two-component sensor histidine kinase
MGSALFIPLRAGEAIDGLLVLLRRQRGEFDGELIQTAELFAERTASAIENARLHDQTRRQAETNAVLLRELNHRVGNNFAGIIGLLTIAANQVPQRSRQWVNRAIERVHMMARAHELFSGGARSIGLADLVRTTLASVSIDRKADIHVSVDLPSEEVKLGPTQAVTLAMVLHELAYNAVVHALGTGGELIVRGRREGADRLAIDVMDRALVPVAAGEHERLEIAGADASGGANGNGNGNSNGGASGHAGIGLHLVRNLVSRELRGSFRLVSTPTTGTVASVEIPLIAES